eukprot:m.37462 g.37462  ORF g.37462 m.37462 type:complete len:410 (+) comp9318_c0_seq2:300-1529(+)
MAEKAQEAYVAFNVPPDSPSPPPTYIGNSDEVTGIAVDIQFFGADGLQRANRISDDNIANFDSHIPNGPGFHTIHQDGMATPVRLPRHQRERSCPPPTPPPLYPSPPGYRSPPRGHANSHELRSLLEPSSTVLPTELAFMLEDSDDELIELAPAYKDDIGFFAGVRRDGHLVALFLTMMVYGLLAIYFSGLLSLLERSPQEFHAAFFVLYGVYMIENLGSETSGYLWRLTGGDDDARVYVRKMLETPPWVRWTINCYHFSNERSEVDSPMQASATGTKIKTFAATHEYRLEGCQDDSPLVLFTSHQICKMQFQKTKIWRDTDALLRYETAKNEFVQQNNKDLHYEIIEQWGIPGFIDKLLVVRNGNKLPFWIGWGVFVLAAVAGMGFWYRTFLSSRTGNRTFTFKKVIW